MEIWIGYLIGIVVGFVLGRHVFPSYKAALRDHEIHCDRYGRQYGGYQPRAQVLRMPMPKAPPGQL